MLHFQAVTAKVPGESLCNRELQNPLTVFINNTPLAFYAITFAREDNGVINTGVVIGVIGPSLKDYCLRFCGTPPYETTGVFEINVDMISRARVFVICVPQSHRYGDNGSWGATQEKQAHTKGENYFFHKVHFQLQGGSPKRI